MIWQRQSLDYEKSIPNIKKVIEAGYILISEFDDDPDHFPYIVKNNYLNFRAMHAVQVSTEQLSSKMRQHNPEVRWFNNCLKAYLVSKKWTFLNSILFASSFLCTQPQRWLGRLDVLLMKPCKTSNQFEFEVIQTKNFPCSQNKQKTIYAHLRLSTIQPKTI